MISNDKNNIYYIYWLPIKYDVNTECAVLKLILCIFLVSKKLEAYDFI